MKVNCICSIVHRHYHCSWATCKVISVI